jgi:hypothetical protein
MKILGFGLCGCGCGKQTKTSRQNSPKRGHVKGQPYRFARGHAPKRKDGIPDNRLSGGHICARCHREGVVKHYRSMSWLCSRHSRFVQMRAQSKTSGKYIPSHDELEGLAEALVGFKCPTCGRVMNWLRSEAGVGTSTVVTLQHDRDGCVRLICSRCNTRHAAFPGDSFYEVAVGYKRCPRCKNVLLEQEFYPGPSVPSTHCKTCQKRTVTAWRNRHLDRVNAWRRGRAKSTRPFARGTCPACGAVDIRLTLSGMAGGWHQCQIGQPIREVA